MASKPGTSPFKSELESYLIINCDDLNAILCFPIHLSVMTIVITSYLIYTIDPMHDDWYTTEDPMMTSNTPLSPGTLPSAHHPTTSILGQMNIGPMNGPSGEYLSSYPQLKINEWSFEFQMSLDFEDYENEPPLLEELGINWEHIFEKTKAVINPSQVLQLFQMTIILALFKFKSRNSTSISSMMLTLQAQYFSVSS